MKQLKKKFVYSDFNKPFSNHSYETELIPFSSYNINLNEGKILPVNEFEDSLRLIFSISDYTEIKIKHFNFLRSCIHIQIYEYYENLTKSLNFRLFFIDKNLKLFEYNKSDNSINYLNIQFSNSPNIIMDKGLLYFYSNNIICYIDASSLPIISLNSSKISTYAQINEMIVFVDKTQEYNIYFANNDKLTNISSDLSSYNGISVNSRFGKVLKLIRLKNKVYVFQQYKISYLEIGSNGLKLMDTCIVNGKILNNSIFANGYYIYFMTSMGLFIFDGSDIEEQFSEITYRIDYSVNSYALVYNGEYYLKSKILVDKKYEDVLVCFDIEKNSPKIYYLGEIENAYVLQSENCYLLNVVTKRLVANEIVYDTLALNKNKLLVGKKSIKFNRITFGINALKTITGLKIFCTGECSIKISSDIEEKVFEFKDNFFLNRIALRGNVFSIELFSRSVFKIDYIIFEVTSTEEDI